MTPQNRGQTISKGGLVSSVSTVNRRRSANAQRLVNHRRAGLVGQSITGGYVRYVAGQAIRGQQRCRNHLAAISSTKGTTHDPAR